MRCTLVPYCRASHAYEFADVPQTRNVLFALAEEEMEMEATEVEKA